MPIFVPGPLGSDVERERECVSMHREMWNSEPQRTFRALPYGPKNVGRGRRKELAEPRTAEQSARRLDPSATLCPSSRHGKVKDLCFRACPSSFRARWTLISSLYGQVPASFVGCLESSCYLRSERISTSGGLGSLRWCKGRTG